jgi:hypothetical protein
MVDGGLMELKSAELLSLLSTVMMTKMARSKK